MDNKTIENIARAVKVIGNARHMVAFTGAGISLESGVPTFRGGPDSIWSKYDLNDIDIDFFQRHTSRSWNTIKACFYDYMRENDVHPNSAHLSLARMEAEGRLKAIITQNIDALHQAAGSKEVIEFHGTLATCTCQKCGRQFRTSEVDMSPQVPHCPTCNGILKPDFVFFGEGIPADAYEKSMAHAQKADVCIVVGTTAQVMPAGMIPIIVKRHGGTIIEINPNTSELTNSYTDIYIATGAVEAFTALDKELKLMQ